ncbi:hypothetical protein [Reichenbachiella sp. MSK19-1]|uniref:hypothetical protein n=1 Tax=Reichenbachiella sp. MSK19-1 TaxID=1897631 RepID=UPI000E6D1D38|nr:hypothetical protein [Reichenbachiella sp. MSK19-1]RJE75033.1 hypothetical protein BGP76_18140 [Reichenbachiella sp. MSK19-1]
MFTEFEIESLIALDDVIEATAALKKEFVKAEAPYLEISDQDFFSLIMMAPTVGVALADGQVSFFEEMALNKKARKLSKGGYFWGKDPVVFGMKFLLSKYDVWEMKFLAVIRIAMEQSFDIASLEQPYDPQVKVTLDDYRKAVLATPYIFIRFLASFFLDSDEDIISPRSMTKTDHERLLAIGDKLGLNKVPLFHYFCATFEVH